MKKKLVAFFGSYLALLIYHTHSFISTAEFAGRDLVGAYSLLKVFGTGWSTEWFLGFPMFRFYPPGFFFLADTLGAVTGDMIAFKLLIYLSLLVFPPAVYLYFREISGQKTAFLSFILSFSAVFLREPFSLIYQTLQVGLVAQMAAIPVLFLFMAFLHREGRDPMYISGILMALMIVIHPYIAAVGVFYTSVYLLFERDILGLLSSATGFLLTAWWWIPLLEKSWYMNTYTGPTGKLLNWPWLFLPLAFFGDERRSLPLSLTAVSMLFIGTFDLGLPIQFYRFYIYGQILAVLAAAPGLVSLIERLEERIEPRYLLGAAAVAFIAPSIAVDVSPDWRNDLEMEGVVPEEGKMVVETSHSDLYNSYVPIQMISLQSNVTVVNGLYADSSISSPYLLGLEKSFAKNPVPNPIAVEANLSSAQLEERFRYFDIEYALVRTQHAEEKLSFMDEVSSNEEFVLLKHNYSRPDYEPVPVKGSYSEWEKLNREIFRGDLEPMVYEPESEEAISIKDLPDSDPDRDIVIGRQSIRPVNRSQALFGLRYDR